VLRAKFVQNAISSSRALSLLCLSCWLLFVLLSPRSFLAPDAVVARIRREYVVSSDLMVHFCGLCVMMVNQTEIGSNLEIGSSFKLW
jgi:hypothetical protein